MSQSTIRQGIERLIDVMLAAQSRFANDWRDGRPLTIDQCEAEKTRDTARKKLVCAFENSFRVGTWSDEERDGMYDAFVKAQMKHGIYESIFAVGAWLLRYRSGALEESLADKPKPSFDALSGAAKDVMNQMFLNGPIWDGDVVAKSGRGELCDIGWAEHRGGWAYLTREGVEAAIVAPVKYWADKRWYRKQQGM